MFAEDLTPEIEKMSNLKILIVKSSTHDELTAEETAEGLDWMTLADRLSEAEDKWQELFAKAAIPGSLVLTNLRTCKLTRLNLAEIGYFWSCRADTRMKAISNSMTRSFGT